ncbi:hypothetical protein MKW94_007823 [Papaver nudicaule]|uniref:TF-B3 domain-containing protein n=1 Tax=Papaver nudicaule TaxID=74823 RepID=A0AA41VST9_PAPNU|nr:hypothetical protein [Papaver nudicaule]
MAITRNQRASKTNVSTDNDGTNEIGLRRPRFYKILHNFLIQHGSLDIPPKFVEKYGADLSHYATLQVSDGLIWGVKLNRNSNGGNGDVSCQMDQLDQFFEYYSVSPGHLLLFKYHGNSQFHVVICDMTATEINYPSDSSDDEVNFHEGGPSEIKSTTEEENEEEEDEDEDSFEQNGDEDDDEEEEISDYASSDEDECSLSSSEEEVRVPRMNKKKQIRSKSKDEEVAMRMTKQRAILIGNEFKSRSKNHFFAIGLQPAYISNKYLPIPASFTGMHMFSNEERGIRAMVDDRRFWLLGIPKEEQRGRLTVGVAGLFRDNDLRVGDVILVELKKVKSKSTYLEAKVHIHRV